MNADIGGPEDAGGRQQVETVDCVERMPTPISHGASERGLVLSWHVPASQVDHKMGGGSIHKAPELPLWPSAPPEAAASPL